MAISYSGIPTVIAGRYRLEGELGRGGMAEVRAGTDLRLERPVAVKFLLPEMAARDDIRRRFEAEARSAAALSHPNAVAVFDTDEQDGIPYIVMERLPGQTLADRIAAGPVDEGWLRQVSAEVLAALAAAHAAGLVHRDVKPGNILLTADGHAKIADFGIAKSLEGSTGSLDLTGAGQLLGTPAYLAPELLNGAPATARSDVYAYGVVLYEALTGTRPFTGDTPLAVARAVVAGDYRPLAVARPDLDPALVATVEQAMAADPARRFVSAPTLAAALAAEPTLPGAAGAAGEPTIVDPPVGPPTSVLDVDAIRGGPPIEVPAPGRTTAVPTRAAPRATRATRRVRTARRPRGRLPLAVLATVAFVVLLVVGTHHHGPTTPAATAGPTTTKAGPTTTLSATASLAADLRSVADSLSPADGARAGDLATSLRQIADQVQAGDSGAGGAATGAMISAGAWHVTGQLSDQATAAAVNVLSRVPGVTVVTLPSSGANPAPTPAPRPAPNTAGKGKPKKN